jgi:hypothetical protein
MPRAQVPFYALNAGEVDPDALARIDLEKLRLAGEQMVNFTPTVLGGMHMRPGTKYLGPTRNNGPVRLVPFVFNATTTSLIEISPEVIRVRNNDALVTYPNYSATITNPQFTSAMGTGWTNASTAGASATSGGGALFLDSSRYTYARARQSVNIPSGEVNTLHCLRIEIFLGPVTLRIGTSAGGENLVSRQYLDTGSHYIAFTPTATTVHIELEGNKKARGLSGVSLVQFVKNNVLEIPSPWNITERIKDIRYAQSGSVIYVACRGFKPYRIERRGQNSWGITEYQTSAGPYIPARSGTNIRLRPTGGTDNIEIHSDQPFFKPEMIGSVFEITHPRQAKTEVFIAADQVTEPVKISGVGEAGRSVNWGATYSSGATGTVRLERAFGTPDAWGTGMKGNGIVQLSASGGGSFTDSDSDVSSDPRYTSLDNTIVYYRLKVTGNVTGTISVYLVVFSGASQTGVARITGYVSPTVVSAEVLSEFGDVTFSDDWREGAWSANQSYPSAVSFYDGRLWWGGLDKVYGSVSDDFQNFDPNTEGDAGPIVRSIATGPVENIGWMLPLQRLIVGTASAEVSIRSSSFDEPLTPAKFTARNASTMGSAAIQAATVDSSGVFVQKNRSKVFEFLYDVNVNDYSSRDLTRLNKNVCRPGVVDLAVQRQPDTRVWFVKSDGTMAMLVYERSDEVIGWSRFEMDGAIEAVCVLPSENDDIVYIAVRRVIDGQTVRHIEKLTVSSETEDGDGSWLVDSSIRFTTGGAATKTISGLQHLVGKQVVAKGASSDPMKRFTVTAGGQIFIDNFVTSLVVGLPYEARFESVKLAYGSASGTALTQKKRVDHLSIVANNTAPEGISIGRNFASMTKLSSLMHGKPLTAGQIVDQYDYDATSFGGAWDSDSRVCIKCQSPYPAHILGMVITMNNNDKVYQWPKKPQQSGGDEEA